MSFSHSQIDITGSVTLSAAPVASAVFNVQLLLDDETNGTTLDGDRFRKYTSTAQITTDFDAGFLSSGAKTAALSAFTNGIGAILIGRVDTAAGTPETYSSALALVELETQGFYYVHIDSRVSADIVTFATTVESFSRRILFAWQSADAGLLTAGLPAPISTIVTLTRNFGYFHTTVTEPLDVAHVAARISTFTPDQKSVPFNGRVNGIADYSPEITQAEGDLARENNINVYGDFKNLTNWVAASDGAGLMLNGVSIFIMVTADLWYTRTTEDFANIIVSFSARKDKLPLNAAGQNVVVSIIEQRISLMIAAKHFNPEEPVIVVAEEIDDPDKLAKRMRFTAEVSALGNASVLTFTFFVEDAI